MTAPLRSSLALACVLSWLSAAHAETVYVIDKLLVGIHAEKNLDSAILKVLPTGSVLEVLERDGELAYVQDADAVKGWVDAAYLTSDQPAQLRLDALVAEKTALEQRVAELEQAGPAAAAAPADVQAQVEALTRDNTELKGKLSDERLRAGKLQSEVAELRARLSDSTTPPDARIVELERARDRLERELELAAERNAELAARSSLQATAAMVPLVLKEYATVILVALALLVALAFGAGVYVVDLLNRRRHGGFRV